MELKNLLNKKTIVSTSIGTLMAMSAVVWTVAGQFNEAVAQIARNTGSIAGFSISQVDLELALAKKERRELRRDLRETPNDEYLLEDMDEVDDNIHRLSELRSCLINPNIKQCGQ
jgi:hypothetical protein